MIYQTKSHDLCETAARLFAEADAVRAAQVLVQAVGQQPQGCRRSLARIVIDELVKADPSIAALIRRDINDMLPE